MQPKHATKQPKHLNGGTNQTQRRQVSPGGILDSQQPIQLYTWVAHLAGQPNTRQSPRSLTQEVKEKSAVAGGRPPVEAGLAARCGGWRASAEGDHERRRGARTRQPRAAAMSTGSRGPEQSCKMNCLKKNHYCLRLRPFHGTADRAAHMPSMTPLAPAWPRIASRAACSNIRPNSCCAIMLLRRSVSVTRHVAYTNTAECTKTSGLVCDQSKHKKKPKASASGTCRRRNRDAKL